MLSFPQKKSSEGLSFGLAHNVLVIDTLTQSR